MKIIMALSGGMDSTTVLGKLLSEGHEVECYGFCYGSKHNQYENAAAVQVARFYDVPYQLIDLTTAMAGFTSNLLKTGGPIPEGHYEAPNMAQTVVPGRNIIFISLLSGLAWSREASGVAVGIHQGDHAIYDDCRKEFFKAMDTAVYLGTGGKVQLIAPFVDGDKVSILEWGLANNVPYALTRTCYKDQPIACGKCGSCQERLEGFSANGVLDPVEYE